MPKGKNSLGCWIAAVAVVCVVLTAAGAGAAVVFWPKPPADMSVAVTAPENVQADTDFNIIVRVTNNGNQPIQVSEIRLPASITDVADPLGVEPTYLGFRQQGSVTVILLDQRIEPGANLPFSILMHARQDGEVSGAVEVTADAQGKSSDLKMSVVLSTTTPRPTPTGLPSARPNLRPFASILLIIAYQTAQDGSLTPVWSGSGSIIFSGGYILTNYHVALGDSKHTANQLRGFLADRQDAEPKAKYILEVVESNKDLDLAVLRITKDINGNPVDASTLNLPALSFGDSDKLSLNDNLTIIGFPGIGGKTITETRGIVSGFTAQDSFGDRAWIKTDTTIAGGDSGGAVLNDQGLLVGVPTRAGSGDNMVDITDCRAGLADTNGDGVIDQRDTCIPIGGFINAIRPIRLAVTLIVKATGQKVVYADTNPDLLPTLLFWDDFTNKIARWDQHSDAQGTLATGDGTYRVVSAIANQRVIGRPHLAFQDLRMMVDASLFDPSTDGVFGILCRYRDAKNYYFFQVGPGASIAIGKLVNGEETLLASKDRVKEIRTDSANQIQAECLRDHLTFWINSIPVVDAQDTDFAAGDIGLFAMGNELGGAEAIFDNLFVYLEIP
jgi:S1-C subfamily serine protease